MAKFETKNGTSIPAEICSSAQVPGSASLWELHQLNSCDNVTGARSFITVFITTNYEKKEHTY